MEKMKAIRIHAYGGREVLSYEEAPRPEIANDEVMVRVAATTVNPFDCAARSGYVAAYFPYTFPHILGLDVSGTIEAVGPDVQGFQVGDAVYGRAHPSKNGAYAEFIALPAALVAAKPQSLDFIQSAAVPQVAYTAWYALNDLAQLSAGQTVLIHGAAGGVGTFATQIAKYLGARVIGTCSDYNIQFLRDLGADEVIDYNAARFEDLVHDVDVVLDLVGDAGDNTQQRSWKVLKPGGILLSTAQFPSPETAAEHNVRTQMVAANGCNGQALAELGALIDAGHIKPVVTSTFPLAEIQQAHALSESRHVQGKIVVQVGDLK